MEIAINKLIDHTLLKPEASSEQIETLCQEALEHDFASVMVNPCRIEQCVQLLKDSDVLVATVIGFPLGANSKETKVAEVQDALAKGAQEIDMVLNIGLLKEGKTEAVIEEIKAIKALLPDKILKVIIETALLNEEEKIRACHCVSEAKADFIKTSTGFSTHGATVEDVALLRKHVAPEIAVKAAGGVRSYEDLVRMVEAGATRIGTSSGVALVSKKVSESSY